MIAIVGYGFVGKAVHAAFPTTTVLVDPILGTSLEDIPESIEYIFVCVPTPSNEDGSIDDSVVVNTVNHCLLHTSATVIVKSSIIPAVVDKFLDFLAHRVCINPEFLTERRAIEDMINADSVLIGGNNAEVREAVWDLYLQHSRCTASHVNFVTLKEACWIKYITNTMLAAKVALLNEYYAEIANPSSWNHIIKTLSLDKRLGNSHWLVPGPDNKFGFGGACFPKDLNAFLHNSENFDILETVRRSNNRIREQYELDSREKAQNISFGK